MALIDNLVSYWKLDEESGTREDAHASNDLTDNNSVLFGAGIINNAANFELDNSESLSIADASQSGLDFTANLSFSLWLKNESALSGNEYRILVGKYAAGDQRQYRLGYDDGNAIPSTVALRFDTSTDGNSGTVISCARAQTFDTGVFYHVVLTSNSSGEVKFYVNGSQVGTTATGNTSIANKASAFFLGTDGAAAGYWDGLMDEVGVWARELTSTEVGLLYNGGAGLAYPLTEVSGPVNLKSYNTNLKANIKSINTNLIANVKSLDTNT